MCAWGGGIGGGVTVYPMVMAMVSVTRQSVMYFGDEYWMAMDECSVGKCNVWSTSWQDTLHLRLSGVTLCVVEKM